MKKTLILLLFLVSFLKADYTFFANKCVDFWFLTTPTSIFYRPSGTQSFVPATVTVNDLNMLNYNKGKFYYDNGVCRTITDYSTYYGMTPYDYNYSMAIYGIFLSSLIAFGLIKAF